MKKLSDFRRDVLFGIRLLRRFPAFSAASILTLAVAIGANTAVFTTVNALLLTPPAVFDPEHLARVDTGQSLASWPTYEDIRTRSKVFASVAAYRLASMDLVTRGQPVPLRGEVTSPNYLAVLGIPPQIGHPYTAHDNAFDRVVLGHHVWRQHFGSDPNIIGRSVTIGGRSLQVTAVMSDGFRGLAPPGVRIDCWVPVDPFDRRPGLRNRMLSQFEIVGRLQPRTDFGNATAELRSLAGQIRREYPEMPESLLAIEARSVEGFNSFHGMASLVLPVFAFLAYLTVVSAFVLVVGCSNIAGLLVGQGAMRQRELALRLSLGSSRGRLLRQLLTESFVLAVLGGAGGVAIAGALIAIVQAGVARLPFPLQLDLPLDQRVLTYLVALSTVTSVLFGLLPARSALRVDLISSLKGDASGSLERRRLRRLMVIGQVAVCSALVVWSMLFIRSLGNVHGVDPGFDPSNVVLSTVELDRGAISAERGEQILTEWTQRVAASADVRAAGLATIVPLALTGREEFSIVLPGDADRIRRRVIANRITPGWLATVRIPLVAGRDFTWSDRIGAPDVAIVNETAARQLWNGAALAQRILYGDRSIEIVGIARDSKYRLLGETIRPLLYLPFRQTYAHFVTLYARSSDPRTTAAVMTGELHRLLPDADVKVESMTDAVAAAVLPAQIGATATGAFAAIAVALAAFGIYRLVSFSVVQRTREIGIRRAVGATASDVVQLIVGHHSTLIGIGLAIGLALGVTGAIVLRAFFTGVGPTDPVTLLTTVALMVGAAVVATVLPALRATRVDPMASLRDV